MRAPWIAGIVAASLGLSACGATATIRSSLSSLGSSPDVQFTLTATASGPGTAEAESVLQLLTIDLDYSNPTGAALSQAGTSADAEVTVDVGSLTLADVRDVGGNDYVLFNPSTLSSFPSLSLSTSQIAGLQLVFGGRWFEVPKSVIKSYLPSSSAAAKKTAAEQAAEKKIVDALSKLINSTPYTTLPGGGFSQSGSLMSVVNAVLPAIESLEGTTLNPPAVKGTYTITLSGSGSNATGGSITITTPNGTQGNVTVGIQATVTHNDDSVTAPSGATIFSKSLLEELLPHLT